MSAARLYPPFSRPSTNEARIARRLSRSVGVVFDISIQSVHIRDATGPYARLRPDTGAPMSSDSHGVSRSSAVPIALDRLPR